MHLLHDFLNWCTGGEQQYMRLYSCMQRDWFWISTTITLDVIIALGYMIIAMHWWKNQRKLPDVPAKRALAHMRNIFIFCGLCGYIFIPIKMFWPAWRLYDFALLALAYQTWRYALTASNLKVVYSELGRSTRLAADLERSQRESLQKSQFLNALSHDLRTPLNGLTLQTSVAELALKDNDREALSAALVSIRNSTQATARLLDTLLECARADVAGEQNHISSFELDGMLGEIVSRHEGLASQRGIYVRSIVPRKLVLHTDRTKLDRILTNLISNAIKFTSTGGVRVAVDSACGGVEIHVIDTGVGIAQGEHEQLFDEFYQIKNHERDPSKGFGLGLSIARRLARQLGGDIMLESSPGNGSRFSVVLPGVTSAPGAPAILEQLEPGRSFAGSVPAGVAIPQNG